jgi:hypothetical protein
VQEVLAMNANNADGWPPGADFIRNVNNVPAEEQLKYDGQHVAWNWEGTQILAGASSYEELMRKLAEMGIDFRRVVFDYLDSRERF